MRALDFGFPRPGRRVPMAALYVPPEPNSGSAIKNFYQKKTWCAGLEHRNGGRPLLELPTDVPDRRNHAAAPKARQTGNGAPRCLTCPNAAASDMGVNDGQALASGTRKHCIVVAANDTFPALVERPRCEEETMGQRKATVIGVGVLGVGVLCFTTPPIGIFVVLGLIAWIVSIVRNPTGSAFVARLSGTQAPTKSQHLVGATYAMGGVVFVAVCSIAGGKVDAARVARQAAEVRAVEQKKVDDEAAELRRAAPTSIAQVTATLTAATAALDAGRLEAVESGVTEGKAVLAKYEGLSPSVTEMTVLGQQFSDLERRLSTIVNAKAALDGAELRNAQADIKAQDYAAADKRYDDLLKKLDVPAESEKYVPMADVRKMRATVESKRRAIASRVQKQEMQEAAARLYEKACGDKPRLSPWDGEVVGLEDHLKETANDPSSIDVEKCTIPVMTEKHCWVSSCNVRGKNAFGALILLRKTYSFSTLGIEEVR